MDREMYPIRISTTEEGTILIGADIEGLGWQALSISPEQAGLVADWLLEAKAELMGEKPRQE